VSYLVIDVAALGFAVAFGAVVAFVGRIGARVFLRIGGNRAGSSKEQGRAGGQQQGVSAQTFHGAKVSGNRQRFPTSAREFLVPNVASSKN